MTAKKRRHCVAARDKDEKAETLPRERWEANTNSADVTNGRGNAEQQRRN